jgi:hypothetical protein
MTGTVNVFIPRTASGDLLTGEVSRTRPRVRSIEVRTYLDPMADRNLSNALPLPARKARSVTAAPRGWRLAPKESTSELRPVPNDPPVERTLPASSEPSRPVPPVAQGATCPSCGRTGFRRSGKGLAWHVQYCHGRVAT